MLSGLKKEKNQAHARKSYVRQIHKSILDFFHGGQLLEHGTVQHSAATME